ncbi:MAG: HAMP domain-containing histidine kinase, partial [Prevotella sp.]|nr:HAMP domain-containing histidine kinase [Prevotella sp.]
GNALLDIIAIVGIILLFVGATIALVFTMRGGNTGNLKREFKAVAHLSITLTDCNVFAINVRRQWVYNVSGDFLPQGGLSMKDYEKLIHPDDLYIEQEACRRVDAGERNMPLISFRMKKHNAAPDEWRQMRVDASVKSDKRGMPIYVYLAMHDETDRLKEQKLLDIQLREFSHITEITDFGMAYYDAKGRLANCNSAMIQIFDKGGVGKGEQYLRSTTRDDLKIIFNGLMLDHGQKAWFCCPVDIPELNLHVTLELRINPVMSDDGRYQGFSLCALDLSEKLEMYHRDSVVNRKEEHNRHDLYRYHFEEEYVMREMETLNNKFQQVQQLLKEQTKIANDAAKQKTIFLANMTHELRTPLNLINGFAEVMQVGATKEEKEQYFAIMQHNCTMLINIIDNILRLSNIDTDGITIKLHLIDFAKAFVEAAGEMKKYFVSSKVEYIVESPLSALDVEVDFEHIKVILDALVNNAVKNTHEGTIRVGFTYHKNERILSVYCQDTGCGIPQDKQNEIFDLFKKVNAFVPGTGIGLHVCKLIADAMNATIDVESTEGKGSTFTLNIPV